MGAVRGVSGVARKKVSAVRRSVRGPVVVVRASLSRKQGLWIQGDNVKVPSYLDGSLPGDFGYVMPQEKHTHTHTRARACNTEIMCIFTYKYIYMYVCCRGKGKRYI